MLELQQYLTGQYHLDREDIEKAILLINEVQSTLVRTFDEGSGWPYLISSADGVERVTKVSHSTTAMVTLALSRMLLPAGTGDARVNPHPFAPSKLLDTEEVKKVVDRARRLLAADICRRRPPRTLSGTFGDDDPATLAFLAELYGCDPAADRRIARVQSYARTRARELCRLNNLQDPTKLWRPDDNSYLPVSNALMPLRVMRAMHHTKLSPRPKLDRYRRYFEATLHEQLSFSSIPDSRFDPGELTFCLEGLLLAQREALDQSVFIRTLDVLGRAQKENAFWRPNKPILATSRGLSLFPVSVEIAISLANSCLLYDGDELFDAFASSSIELFRRYWQWLRARTIRFHKGSSSYVGWNSEHVNESGLIHIWETSQVLEFLVAYCRLMERHIARRTLLLSRFNVKPAKLPKDSSPWSKIEKSYEPVTSLGNHYEVYSRIGTDFVAQWRQFPRKNYSMLLYGPPGTGKTTVAENIAKALRTRIINISVSDFVAGGSAEVEGRAKALFEVLNAQSNCVVLLDEIDQLVLDRDGARYSQQQTIFQFMTPGMLTKLNDLRAAERVLFIIATNYGNRIDSAIKRPGRIDQQYLVLPPDARARRAILQRILKKAAPPVNSEVNPKNIDMGGWRRLQRSSLFLGFKEIEAASLRSLQAAKVSLENLERTLVEFPRTTSLTAYEARFKDANSGGERPPEEEFLCLVAMRLQQTSSTDDIKSTVRQAASWFGRHGAERIPTEVQKSVGSLKPTLLKKVQKCLTANFLSEQAIHVPNAS